MRFVYATLALAIVSSVQALPLQKRIQQVIADSLTAWEQACLAAGGGQQCNPLKVDAFTTLLAAAGPCDQQDNADKLIDLAHQLNNDPEMIRLAQIFTQQPRNSPNSVTVVYCQNPPRNQELAGLFQCQFEGVDDNRFTADTGTVPLGLTSLSPPGSCPAHPQGKIPDGVQLVTLVTDPGVPSTGNNNGDNNGDNNGNNNDQPVQAAPSADNTSTANEDTSSAATPPPATTAPASTTPASDFQVANAQDAQQQNQAFASLSANDSCTDGQVACIGEKFAQCANGQFVVTACAQTTQCMTLPLVNSRGTSVTCTTLEDAAIRFSAISGGFDGQH